MYLASLECECLISHPHLEDVFFPSSWLENLLVLDPSSAQEAKPGGGGEPGSGGLGCRRVLGQPLLTGACGRT